MVCHPTGKRLHQAKRPLVDNEWGENSQWVTYFCPCTLLQECTTRSWSI